MEIVSDTSRPVYFRQEVEVEITKLASFGSQDEMKCCVPDLKRALWCEVQCMLSKRMYCRSFLRRGIHRQMDESRAGELSRGDVALTAGH